MNFLTYLENDKEFLHVKKTISLYTNRAYLVGGSVRDLLLGKTPKDFDIELYDLGEEKLSLLARSLNAKGVGKSFFVYKYNEFDLSLPRVESKVAPTHQGFEVRIVNEEKLASKRRDFTMNALMLNIFTGEIKDFWGGINDIKTKTIRLIDEKKFAEDSLRVLRGARFSSQLGFVIDDFTCKVMKKMDLSEISKTRIFWELEKIFVSPYPALGLLYLFKLGILEKILHVKVDFASIFNVAIKMENAYKYKTANLSRYIFLYVLVNELKLDMRKVLTDIEAPKYYFTHLDNVLYFTCDTLELLKLSLQKPLREWVGVCAKGIQKEAKALGVWDRKFPSQVTSEEVLKDGFKGKAIGDEITRRKIEEIREFLKAKNG